MIHLLVQRRESLLKHSKQPKSADLSHGGRIAALDGLRGLAALVVVVFHFFCLLFPAFVPDYAPTPIWLADTPLGILWNGPFAVSVFFVLSGFVIAGAADRRHDLLVSNLITRYLRLAVPVTASVLLAWTLLSIFPTATADLRDAVDNPSAWLVNTHQGNIPSLGTAIFDGVIANFVRGGSGFNNVLWTMKIELIGSIGIFGIYWVSAGRARIILLAFVGFLVPVLTSPYYMAFVLGALIFEAHTRNRIRMPRSWMTWVAFAAGVALGAAGQGTAQRWGLPDLPGKLVIGNPVGIIPVLAAALILFAVIALPGVARFFSVSLLRWLGRVSFGLYLVHVPLLYTLVAVAYVRLDWSITMLATAYVLGAFVLAHLLTILIDEPTLRLLKPIRGRLTSCDRISSISRAS